MKTVPQKEMPVMLFMTLATHSVRHLGYSKKWPPTWYQAWNKTGDPAPELRDAMHAQQVVTWVLSLRPIERTSYFWSAIEVIQRGTLTRDEAPLMASLVQAFEREGTVRRRAETMTERLQLFRSSVYFGTLGVRAAFDLTVQDTEPIDSLYGGTVVFFRDSNGNMAKWIASRVPEQFQEDRTLRVRATVKDHRETHGIRHTVITRVALDAPKISSRPTIRSARCSLRTTSPGSRNGTR